jgi:hypothetical protein
VVRPKKPGTLDLGEITLPFWNPERKAYDVARASLGNVQVAAGRAVAKDPSAPRDPWASLGPLRDKLGGFARAREPLTDKTLYWVGLFGAPFAVVAGSVGSRSMRRLRARFVASRSSRERNIEQALSQARDAKKREDRAALAAALERAVYLAIERATAVRARALLLDEIPGTLQEHQVPPELAAEVRELLSSLEATRFAPDATPHPAELSDRVTTAVRRLGRLPAAQGA